MSARRGAVAVAALLGGLAAGGAPVAAAQAAPPVAGLATGEVYPLGADPLPVTGHGYGHGHGLSQYGAQGAALQHVGYRDILAHYYPGTAVGGLPPGTVRVRISEDTDDDLVVRPDPGLVLADSDGARWLLPAGPGAWRVSADGAGVQHVQQLLGGAWQPWASPDGRSAFRTASFSGPARVRVDLPGGVFGGGGQAYRGTVTAVRGTGGAVDTVNTVDLEQYLQGVVPRESPASWQPDALRAQAVAARSYAAWERAAAGSRAWDTCSTSACQVYRGSASYAASGALTESEPASSTAAVQATAGEVRLWQGGPAFTQFTSSTGGWNADGGQPYLAAGADPWDGWAGNPVHTWTGSLTAARVAAAYPSAGAVRDVRVVSREGQGEWGGRITSMVVEGVSASGVPTSVTTSGSDFAWRLGLRSNWWVPQLGAVQLHWLALGGSAGWLGAPRGGEHDVPGGRAQEFAGGIVYWSPATGARAVRGAVLGRYLALGGPGGALGLPTTDELGVPGGAESDFARGRLVWSPATGAVLVHGAVGQLWVALGGAGGRLGLPLADEEPSGPAVRQRFAAGTAYWTPVAGARTVTGALLASYASRGEAAGPLGPPVADAVALPGGSGQSFASGVLLSSAAGVHEVHGAVLGTYLAHGGAGGLLGMPTADEAAAAGARVSTFTGGDVWWSPATGAHEVHGALRWTWLSLGGPGSGLGLPTSDEYAVPGGRRSDFAGGALTWQAANGGVVVTRR